MATDKKRKRQDGLNTNAMTLAAFQLKDLQKRYKNMPHPEVREQVPQEIRDSIMFYQPENRSYLSGVRGWKLVKPKLFELMVYKNRTTKQYKIAFHYNTGIPPQLKELGGYFANTLSQDAMLTFKNIPFNITKNFERHPAYSQEIHDALAEIIKAAEAENYSVEMVGYSMGGHTARYWGSVFDVDQTLLNAHTFNHNTFPETTATSHYHTIAKDPWNFKYRIPGQNRPVNERHYLYQEDPLLGQNGHDMYHFTPGEDTFWDAAEDFEAAEEVTKALEKAETGLASKVERGAGYAANIFAAADVELDIADGDYVSAGVKTAALAAYMKNPVLGQAVLGTGMIATGGYEISQGQKGTGARHIVEGAAMDASIAAGPMGMLGVGEAVGSVEFGFQAADDAKHHRTGDAIAHGTESALLGLGTLAIFVPGVGPLLSLGLGATAAAVDFGNHLRHEFDKPDEAENPEDEKRDEMQSTSAVDSHTRVRHSQSHRAKPLQSMMSKGL